MVTLSFFETLIGLNCEDVMLWLIFKHLISQTVFLPSQRPLIRHPDIHGRTVEKLLQMTPICCLEARALGLNNSLNSSLTASSLPTFLVGLGRPQTEDGLAIDPAAEAVPEDYDYQPYLMDARKAVRDRFEATRCWQYDYDGLNPASNNNTDCDIDASEAGSSSTPYGSGPVSLTEEEDREFWSLMRSDERLKRVKATGDNLSLGSNLSWNSSNHADEVIFF